VLVEATNTDLKEDTMSWYLKNRTRTQVVKLPIIVPVELRYETIVMADGSLHIYRDVYNKNTNTEENLRAVFDANGISFDTLAAEEKSQVLNALHAMSAHPKVQPKSSPTQAATLTREEKLAAAAARKAEADRQRELRNQKEIVIDFASLSGKGYPGPVNLSTGARAVATDVSVPAPSIPKRPRRSPTPEAQPSPRKNPIPAPQPTPAAVPSPRSTASPQ